MTAAFGKLALNLGKFATTAMKDFMGLSNAAKQRVALEEAVIRLIQSEPTYLDAVERGTLDILKVEKDIFAQIELNNLERATNSGNLCERHSEWAYSEGGNGWIQRDRIPSR